MIFTFYRGHDENSSSETSLVYGHVSPGQEHFYVSRKGNNYVNADPTTDFIHWNLVFVVTPAVSILGIIGNTLSLVILAKHGFHKNSNILLFSLAISDILFMIGINGPPKPMYEWGSGGFQYPELTSRVLYYLYHCFDSLNWGSGPTSLFIPVLITVERLLAVFLPLRFASIVTPRRTVVAVLTPTVVSYGIQIYIRNWFRFVYVHDSVRNVSVGLAVRTDMYWSQRQVSKVLEMFLNLLIFLVIFVFCGCVAIGIKIKMASNKRLKMTNSVCGKQSGKLEPRTSRTTKMLLCLCLFYTVACAPIGLPAFMPGFMVFPLYTEDPNFRSVGVFIYHVYKLIFSINASVNFVIYVVMSKTFRDTFLSFLRH